MKIDTKTYNTMNVMSMLVLALLSFSQLNAQVIQEWVSRYNGPANYMDRGHSIVVDGLGNVYVTGYSHGNGTNTDYATIKYNSSGDSLWIARYNGPGNFTEQATSITVDSSGNVYVTGTGQGIGTNEDYVTIKYNSSGDSLWVARYNGPVNSNEEATSIAVDGSGNVYVTGSSPDGGTGNDYATIKYNSSGDSLWVARYNGPGNFFDKAFAIAVDDSGNVYVTGKSSQSGANYDYATIKYNSSGIQQWVQRYNGLGNNADEANSIALDDLGNVYVTGYSAGDGTFDDYTTIKYNSSGVQQWIQIYNGTGQTYDNAYSMAVDGSGNVYVTGGSWGGGTSYDYATIKYNSSGVQQWVSRYNGPGNEGDIAQSVALDGLGNVYITGSSRGSGTGIYDYATIKYDSAGVQQWVQRYNGPGNEEDVALSIAVDGSGNAYVTGYSVGSGTNYDYATIKYSQTQNGVDQISFDQPESYSLFQNYPNPFNPSTTIQFELPSASFVTLKIFNLLGQEVATLINEKRDAGQHSVKWNAQGIASGVYFYRLYTHPTEAKQTTDFVQTKNLLLIR